MAIEPAPQADTRQRTYVDRAIEPAQADTVRRIFTLVADGAGFKAVAKGLNGEGVTSPRPKAAGRSRTWTASSVRAIVFNPHYTGR